MRMRTFLIAAAAGLALLLPFLVEPMSVALNIISIHHRQSLLAVEGSRAHTTLCGYKQELEHVVELFAWMEDTYDELVQHGTDMELAKLSKTWVESSPCELMEELLEELLANFTDSLVRDYAMLSVVSVELLVKHELLAEEYTNMATEFCELEEEKTVLVANLGKIFEKYLRYFYRSKV
jgi:hypothetical protein